VAGGRDKGKDVSEQSENLSRAREDELDEKSRGP